MKRRKTIGWVLGVLLLSAGCSSAPIASNGSWVAQPELVEVKNSSFNITIEPQKADAPYYAFFTVTISNKSNSNLIVDWNKSRYLYNGKSQGMLVFAGIDPDAVKTGTVPPDVIKPGSDYSREIMPQRLIAWSPIKEKTVEERSILPGMFPEGENGVGLVFQKDGKEIVVPLSVRIIKEDVK